MFTVEGPTGGPTGSLGVGCCPLGWESVPGGLTSDRNGMIPGPRNGFFPRLQSWLRASLTQALLLSP